MRTNLIWPKTVGSHPLLKTGKAYLLLVLTACLFFGASAQRDNVSCHRAKQTYEKTFRNTSNQFLLNAVGKVILKENKSDKIRCVVKVTAYGRTEEQAAERLHQISIVSKQQKGIPVLEVKAKNGLYLKRQYDIVTEVYLPPTVTLQHNDNPNFMEILNRLVQKMMPY